MTEKELEYISSILTKCYQQVTTSHISLTLLTSIDLLNRELDDLRNVSKELS